MTETITLTPTTTAQPVVTRAAADPNATAAPRAPRTVFEAIKALSSSEASIADAVSDTGSLQSLLNTLVKGPLPLGSPLADMLQQLTQTAQSTAGLANGPVVKGSPADAIVQALTIIAQRPVEVRVVGPVETWVEHRLVLAETRAFSLTPIWELLELLHRIEAMLERALHEPKQADGHLAPHADAVLKVESTIAGHGHLKPFKAQAKALHLKLTDAQDEVEKLLTQRLAQVRAFTASLLAHAARTQNASHG